jgi:hypothetical protein
MPNDPEAIFKHHLALIGPLEKALDAATTARQSANGAYRAAIKAAKTSGIDTDDLLEFLRLRKKDPEEVTRRFKALNEMLLWGDVPVGTQLGIFEDGRSVATHGEDRKAADGEDAPRKSLSEIGADAFDACKSGLPIGDNPYPTDTVEGQRWRNDWLRAEQEAVDKAREAGAPAKPATAAPPKAGKGAAKGGGKRITAPKTAVEHPDLPPAA